MNVVIVYRRKEAGRSQYVRVKAFVLLNVHKITYKPKRVHKSGVKDIAPRNTRKYPVRARDPIEGSNPVIPHYAREP